MEIRQLKYFISIAETGSFSETSRRMYLSQSAVSQQIKALEDELDTTLFVRSAHCVSLTESGEILLPYARKIVRGMQDCTERMSDINKEPCGELRIGLTFSLESYIRPTIVRFLKEYPKIKLQINYKSIAELRDLLLHHELDLILSIDHTEELSENIVFEPIVEYKLCAIMRESHPLANRESLRFKDLSLQGFALPEPSIRDRNAVEHHLHTETGRVNVRTVINDPNALLNLVRSTNLITILSEKETIGRPGIKAVRIEELSTPVMAYAQTLRGNYEKRSTRLFINALKKNINM